MAERVFGELPDYPEGSLFRSRDDLGASGVHRPRQAGISGSQHEGADSIVLSGGYEDDEDHGDVIIYTGHGGRDPETAQQVSDQLLTRGNQALALSCLQGLPVRVVRGVGHRSPHSPPYGYRYDGLYRVEDYWRERGRSGFTIWRFRLMKTDVSDTLVYPTRDADAKVIREDAPLRVETTVQRIVRDTLQARQIKELYEYSCQVCDTRLESSAGPYAEAAHIRPLGSPHHGSDTADNILCLCPNHHVLLDYGGLAIADDFRLLGVGGMLTVKHEIAVPNLRYRRAHYYGLI